MTEITPAQIAEWRAQRGGFRSAVGEYTPDEFWDLLDEIERLWAECDRLRLPFEGKFIQEALMAMRMVLTAGPEGAEATFRAPIIELVADLFADQFKSAGGINYVSFTVYHPDTGPLVLTMQRKEGKSPGEIAGELRAECERLMEENERLRARISEPVEDLEVSARAFRTLREATIKTIQELHTALRNAGVE